MAEFIRGGASLPHRDKINNLINNGCDDGLDSILPFEEFDPFVNETEEDTTDNSTLTAPPDNLYVEG